ncbi:hypothetical protein [Caulobacter sp. S45]|uniref:hypothetical protein n=1 Tax=Caulobacter sp. S45 TaxID=1641861 RepID=UPI00131B77A0|nr:hypothetical protein [Caulobacter sp. S45]
MRASAVVRADGYRTVETYKPLLSDPSGDCDIASVMSCDNVPVASSIALTIS